MGGELCGRLGEVVSGVRRVLDAGGVAAMSGEMVLLGWLVDEGRVFYVHLAQGRIEELVALARVCLG